MIWIPITLGAVFFQLFRNASAKRLSRTYSPEMVSLARFLPGIPLVAGLFIILCLQGASIHLISPLFFLWTSLMALCQIGANMLLVMLFRKRNFAGCIALVKTETILIALLGIVFLNEPVGTVEWVGIALATVGLMLATIARDSGKGFKTIARSLLSVNSLMALGAGMGLAFATIFVKMSYRCLKTDSNFSLTVFTLLVILCVQSAVLSIVATLKNREEFSRAFREGRYFLATGMFGVLASLCWFMAFAMTKLSNVRTLGQTELVFGILVAAILFRERVLPFEIAGMACIICGTVLIIL